MTKPIARDSIYEGRQFQSEAIELCVRWYITYRLSYRDLAAMMAERGIVVSHTTIVRWVLRYVPEYEKRWGRFARPAGSSWRMSVSQQLADGIDPSARKRTSGKYALAARGEWAADEPGKNVDKPRSSHLRPFAAS